MRWHSRLAWCLSFLVVTQSALAQGKKDRGPVKVTEEALKIHREALVIDGHNDLPYMLKDKGAGSFKIHDLTKEQKGLHTDIPRLKKGGVGAQFWSAWVPGAFESKGAAVRLALEQIDLIHRLVKQYPDAFEMAYSVD